MLSDQEHAVSGEMVRAGLGFPSFIYMYSPSAHFVLHLSTTVTYRHRQCRLLTMIMFYILHIISDSGLSSNIGYLISSPFLQVKESNIVTA